MTLISSETDILEALNLMIATLPEYFTSFLITPLVLLRALWIWFVHPAQVIPVILSDTSFGSLLETVFTGEVCANALQLPQPQICDPAKSNNDAIEMDTIFIIFVFQYD